ncbi:MAG: 16S rRNA (cytidine(1402)-2'-O)-methyltransferase [Candidatus Omnitrophica bacterium]|nr:16S rRNA (cytidine(1402)-2'-O)-methyltransferase [Candidatus Omnitrophota bacterium]MBD3268589.1 16S rRNA (cytidine(1402)-2'-O)-methyltransferase [Candidatus Omnitrophota bacterium]
MLYLVATPIGNSQDMVLRALGVFKEADFVLAEDTRKTCNLLSRFGIKKRIISFYEHNEEKKTPWVLEELRKGNSVVLVSSAGTPTISDPGYKLIRACRDESLPLTSVPGPSSIINALALSSLPRDKFIFLGYMPKKSGARRKLAESVKKINLTAVFFESPHRIVKCLKDLRDVLGERHITVTREMTKKFETVLEGTLSEAIKNFESKKARGELTMILAKSFPSRKEILIA